MEVSIDIVAQCEDMLCSDMIEDIPIDIISESNNTQYRNMINNIIPDSLKSDNQVEVSVSASTSVLLTAPKGIRFCKQPPVEQPSTNFDIVDRTFYKSIMRDSPFVTLIDSPSLPPPISAPVLAPAPAVVTYDSLFDKMYKKTDASVGQSRHSVSALRPVAMSFAEVVLLPPPSPPPADPVSMQIDLDTKTHAKVLAYHKSYDADLAVEHLIQNTTVRSLIKMNLPITLIVARTIASIKHIIKVEQMCRGDCDQHRAIFSAFKLFKEHANMEYNYDQLKCDRLYNAIINQMRNESVKSPFIHNYDLFLEALECADTQYMDIVHSANVYSDNVMIVLGELVWSLQCCQYFVSKFECELENPEMDAHRGYDHVLELVTRIYIYSHSFLDYLYSINRPMVNACAESGIHIPRTIRYNNWSLYAKTNSPLANNNRSSP